MSGKQNFCLTGELSQNIFDSSIWTVIRNIGLFYRLLHNFILTSGVYKSVFTKCQFSSVQFSNSALPLFQELEVAEYITWFGSQNIKCGFQRGSVLGKHPRNWILLKYFASFTPSTPFYIKVPCFKTETQKF